MVKGKKKSKRKQKRNKKKVIYVKDKPAKIQRVHHATATVYYVFMIGVGIIMLLILLNIIKPFG